jgi:hypothetical protein
MIYKLKNRRKCKQTHIMQTKHANKTKRSFPDARHKGTLGEKKDGSTCSQSLHSIEVSGQFYDRAFYLRIKNYLYAMDRFWMGPRGSQDVLKKRKMDCPCQISKSGSSKPDPRDYNKAWCVTYIMMTLRTIEVKPLAWDCMHACIEITYSIIIIIIIIWHNLIKTPIFNVKSVRRKNFHTEKL